MEKVRIWVVSSLIVGGLIAASVLWWPLPQTRILNEGTDAYRAHYPVFSTQHYTQDLTVHGELLGLATIAVNLRHAPDLPPLEVRLRSAEGTEWGPYTIAQDDTENRGIYQGTSPSAIREEILGKVP